MSSALVIFNKNYVILICFSSYPVDFVLFIQRICVVLPWCRGGHAENLFLDLRGNGIGAVGK